MIFYTYMDIDDKIDYSEKLNTEEYEFGIFRFENFYLYKKNFNYEIRFMPENSGESDNFK